MKITSQPRKKVIEKTQSVFNMGKIYKDINGIKIDEKDSFGSLLKKFYTIMESNGICQGNWTENGRTMATPEWCMCWQVFKSNIEAKINWMFLMCDPPNHLLAYGKKPKKI